MIPQAHYEPEPCLLHLAVAVSVDGQNIGPRRKRKRYCDQAEVARLLRAGVYYRDIAAQTGASTKTIAKVARQHGLGKRLA